MTAVPPPPASSSTGRALVPFVPAAAPRGLPAWRRCLVAIVFGLSVGAGGAGAYGLRHILHGSGTPQTVASSQTLHRLEDQVGRLQQSLEAMRSVADAGRADEPLRGLKHSVDGLKQEIDQARAASAATLAQLTARIDKADHDPSPKLADIAARLDRIEKQGTAPITTGSLPPAANAAHAAAALPPTKPATLAAVVKPATPAETTQVALTPAQPQPVRTPTVAGWVLRDVYDGVALVEARGGDLREVGPGQYLPGAGQVRSIERRGRSWVVMTSRGVIGNIAF